MSNIIEYGIGPRDTTEKLWKVTASGGYGGDHSLTIDITEKYLFFAWIYKDTMIGTTACSLSMGFQGTILDNSDGSSLTDPSFINALSWRSGGDLYGYEERWLLCCSYIFPYGTSNSATVYGGIYTANGTKILDTVDYRWSSDPSPWAGESISQSCTEDNVLYIARPSLYLCDEFEPNIKRMIGL